MIQISRPLDGTSNGYPYAIEIADAVAVNTMLDRQEFMMRQGMKFTFSTKSISKGHRR